MKFKLKKNISFLILLICCFELSYSQETFKKKIDSLLEAVKVRDTTFSAYEALASSISDATEKEAKKIFEYAIVKDSSALTRIYIYKGYGKYLSKIGQDEASIQYRHNGLQLAKKQGLEELVLYYHNAIAHAYNFKNQLDSATYHLNSAEAIAEKSYKNWLWNIYYNRALVQGSLGNLEEAASYYRLMWDHIYDTTDPKQKGFALWTIASILHK